MQSQRSTYHGSVPPLYASIDGSRGTMVFGDVPAITGEITEVHPDYVRLETENGDVLHVRHFKYWRFEGEDV